jgi:hypothetical protein
MKAKSAPLAPSEKMRDFAASFGFAAKIAQ